MKGYIPVEIPTKKYIKAFIQSQLGAKPILNQESSIGCKLYDLLQHRTNEDKLRFSNKRYNTTIRVYISMHTFLQRGCNLNETNIKNLNSFIENKIKERYRFILDFYMDIHPSFEANLPYVRKKLGIDDDNWSGDSIRKDYYRYRLSIGKPLLYNKVSTVTVPSVKITDAGF